MKLEVTLRTAIKFGAVAVLSFGVGRLSTHLVGSLFAWPRTPEWMDVNATGVVVNGVVAAGTCAAVIVALVLAVRQSQQKSRDDLNKAHLAAAGAITRLALMSAVTNAVATVIKDSAPDASDKADIRTHIETLQAIRLCTPEEIQALAPLPRDCAAKLAAFHDRYETAIGNLQIAANPHANDSTAKSSLITAGGLLDIADGLLKSVLHTCSHAASQFDIGVRGLENS